MGKFFGALFALAMLANECGAAEYRADANYFGVFTTEDRAGKTGCASVDSKAVTVGAPIRIVVLSKPQRLLNGMITSRSSAECSRFFQAADSADFYDIRITHGKFEPHELGIVVLPTVPLTETKGGAVIAKLGQKNYRFYECSSTEGIHVAVRSGNGKGRAVWYDYIYLGYDVEPTCQNKDCEGTETINRTFNPDKQMRAR
jgi:hypothetical protein